MHKYLDILESRIGSNKFGKFLFNNYYNLRDLYWGLFYAVSLSLLAGFGNALPELNTNILNMLYLVFQGFLNNLYLSLFVNIFYAKLINKFSYGSHLRRNGNILWGAVLLMFISWHYIIGTENPIQANIMPGIASLILTNYQINAVKNSKI